VDIRHAGVTTDSRDDVVMTDRSVWCIDFWGDLWRTINQGDCDALKHLLCVGLDVNQSIQLYDKRCNKYSHVTPLLYTLIDLDVVGDSRAEKLRILLKAGADVNVRVRYRGYGSVLDRRGVSVLERTRLLVCECSVSEDEIKKTFIASGYKRLMCEIKKHVRRYSV
jgi:hypothetical protein